jgi:hypothetical protein
MEIDTRLDRTPLELKWLIAKVQAQSPQLPPQLGPLHFL